MTQITLNVDEKAFHAASEYARAKKTSVDSLVDTYFQTLGQKSRNEASWEEALEVIKNSTASSEGLKITREDAYDRSR